VIENRNFH
jgi:hypothetical protein